MLEGLKHLILWPLVWSSNYLHFVWQTVSYQVGLEILSTWKQVVDNVWVPDSSSNTFEDTVKINITFSLFKVLETIDRTNCNKRNLLKALKNSLIPICAVFIFTTNLRWLSSISFKGCICHGSQWWAFFWDNLSINVVQTGNEKHHSISTPVGYDREDNIHTYNMVTRQVTGDPSRTLYWLWQLGNMQGPNNLPKTLARVSLEVPHSWGVGGLVFFLAGIVIIQLW